MQTSVGHKSGALFTHFALVAHKEGGRRERRYWTGTRSPNGVRPWKTIVEAYAGHNQGRCSLLCIAVCPRTHVLLCPCIHVSLCRCLVSEEQRRDIVEAMGGNSADVRWSQIRGAVHSSCLGHKVRRRRDPQGLKSDGREVCNRHKKGSTCKKGSASARLRHRRDPQGLKSDGREVCNRHKKSSTCKREGLLRG